LIQVIGYAAQQTKAPLTAYSFDRREPRDNDVMIDIRYCGICHTDIHQVRNEWGASTFPMVPGHEIAGIVTGVGTKVTRYRVGDRVGVGNFVDFCSKHDIACDIELTPIQKVNQAYQRVVNNDVRYRFVIDMKSLDPKD
jgi:alcohol dehydrogenase (NADP+)